jgi:hypothetical protein
MKMEEMAGERTAKLPHWFHPVCILNQWQWFSKCGLCSLARDLRISFVFPLYIKGENYCAEQF